MYRRCLLLIGNACNNRLDILENGLLLQANYALDRCARDPILNAGEKQLWFNTHDESVFYANDRRKTQWCHASDDCKPQAKGKGASIMVSDFLSPDYGRLKTDERCVAFIYLLLSLSLFHNAEMLVFYSGQEKTGMDTLAVKIL